jgi:hypothetical protein
MSPNRIVAGIDALHEYARYTVGKAYAFCQHSHQYIRLSDEFCRWMADFWRRDLALKEGMGIS